MVLAEASLRLAAKWSPRATTLLGVQSVPDARLGTRPNPAYPGHDRNGFRNPTVPMEAHILAFGDSHTYGTGVNPADTWPRRLEYLLGLPVYSIAWGGYGPAHSLLLWNEGTALRPRIIIEAFYSGNDLYDSFNLVYGRGQLPEFKATDSSTIEAIARAEASEPLADHVSIIFQMMPPVSSPRSSASVARRLFLLRKWAANRLLIAKLASMGRAKIFSAWARFRHPERTAWFEAQSFAREHPAYCQVFQGPNSRTLFTAEYRLAALDLTDPRIREGQRIILEAILHMKQLADQEKRRFIVLLLPTKELVFARETAGFVSSTYDSLIRNESRSRDEIKVSLRKHAVEYIDTLTNLQKQLSKGQQPYKESADGHPNAVGHRVIAESIRDYIESSNPVMGKPRQAASGSSSRSVGRKFR